MNIYSIRRMSVCICREMKCGMNICFLQYDDDNDEAAANDDASSSS